MVVESMSYQFVGQAMAVVFFAAGLVGGFADTIDRADVTANIAGAGRLPRLRVLSRQEVAQLLTLSSTCPLPPGRTLARLR